MLTPARAATWPMVMVICCSCLESRIRPGLWYGVKWQRSPIVRGSVALPETPAHLVQEDVRRHGFGEDPAGCRYAERLELRHAVPRDQDAGEVGAHDGEPLHQGDPVEPRHDDVGHHHIQQLGRRLDELEG